MPDRTASALLTVLPELLHELSQPIGALRCGIELARMRQPRNGHDADMAVWVQETERLTELLDVMRQLCDIESAKHPPGDCDLAKVLRGITAEVRETAEQRGVTLRLDAAQPLHTSANERHIHSALRAVLEGAVTRAPRGQAISTTMNKVKDEAWISISGLRPDADEWQISKSALRRARANKALAWSQVLAQCAIYRAGGIIQCDPAAGGDGNLLIRLPLRQGQ